MSSAAIKSALKRGALVAAANWEVVLIQFVAESAFKALLVVPVVGAAFLLALLVGGNGVDLLDAGIQEALAVAIDALQTHPGALAAYLAGLLVVVVGGSVMLFAIKGGTVLVLVEAEAGAPPVERPPLTVAGVRRASAFSLERFIEGSDRFRRRFIRLGLLLLGVYAASGGLYLLAVTVAYRWTADPAWAIPGSMAAAAASLAAGLWLTIVNLLYVLVQVLVVAHDWPVRSAARALPPLLRRERAVVGGIFLVMLALVVLATIASVLATGALGFIGFVPVVGLAVLPLQLLAWLARGLLFQFIGLAALGAYAGVLREPATGTPGRHGSPMPGGLIRKVPSRS
jgi:hypothetical protein